MSGQGWLHEATFGCIPDASGRLGACLSLPPPHAEYIRERGVDHECLSGLAVWPAGATHDAAALVFAREASARLPICLPTPVCMLPPSRSPPSAPTWEELFAGFTVSKHTGVRPFAAGAKGADSTARLLPKGLPFDGAGAIF
jgi:hypothetical protein